MICLPVPGSQGEFGNPCLPSVLPTERIPTARRLDAPRLAITLWMAASMFDAASPPSPAIKSAERSAIASIRSPLSFRSALQAGLAPFSGRGGRIAPGSRLQGHPAYLPMQDRFHYVDVGLVSVRREEIVGRLDDPG